MKKNTSSFQPVICCDGGGGLRGYMPASYKALRAKLGPSIGGDGYKVSTSWLVNDKVTGIVFEVYDYKETNLYDSSLQSVRSFRSRPSYDWHIGSSMSVPTEVLIRFSEYLTDK